MNNMKTVVGFGLIGWIISCGLYLGAICGFVYFVFWCLKHFGIIGG